MTKIIKNIIYISLLFVLSGCSISYEVNIEEDRKVNDELIVNVSNTLAGTYYDSPREYLENISTSKMSEFNISNYKKTYDIGNDISKVFLTNTHYSVENYFNSPIIRYLYKNVSVKKEGNNIIILLNGMNDVMSTINNYDENYGLEDFSIVLNSKYFLKDDNADERNIFTGKYVWNFKQDSLGKEIKLTITQNKNYFAIVSDYLGLFIFPVVILIIGVIIYVIYLLFKQKINHVNRI